MPNVIITRSRRGCFNVEELGMFNPPNIVFLKCRNENCGKITTPTIAEFVQINVEVNPCQCSACMGYNLTGSWCNFTERPKTYMGEPPGNGQLAVYTAAMNAMRDYRIANGPGSNPPWDEYNYRIVRETLWCTGGNPPANTIHYDEVFHEFLPNKEGSWTERAATPTVPGLFITRNNEFYRAIINMVIQTEVII